MNVALRKPMTLQAFLDWEARQEQRYEFDGSSPSPGQAGPRNIQLSSAT